jgi:phage/plasmid-associated DNA primase
MPFTADNTATAVCLTNSLPTTPDKSIGFYRKWLIIDFPNQFLPIKENLIERIPIKEFNNLSKKCLRILNELYENPSFTNEGTFEDRTRRYEERSNPVMKFIEEEFEETAGENIILREFVNDCNIYLKQKHLRVLTAIQIGKNLREEGFNISKRTINGSSSTVIVNLQRIKHKDIELPELLKTELDSYIERNTKMGSSGSSGIVHSYDQSWDERQLMEGQRRLPDKQPSTLSKQEDPPPKPTITEPTKPKNPLLKFLQGER